jgi:hypothetical protein
MFFFKRIISCPDAIDIHLKAKLNSVICAVTYSMQNV